MSTRAVPVTARRTQAERREATRAALLEAARPLFAERGYEAVSSEEIVAAAGVTRGALYHHFDGKRGLFAAVFEEVEAELTASFDLSGLDAGDPLGVLLAAVDQFLDLSLDSPMQRIVLIDGPAVLGWEAWHEVERRYGLGLIEAGLTAAVEAGQIPALPVPELALMLLGALTEAGLQLARAEDREDARERAAAGLRALLGGLAG
ncbi:MAG: TetR/AcrR family transcriptional regulator [Solirubrobacterales bacterium]|nr:TetR/AcrR family transcriptional regulator [Solirubrobacterales bacterium]